MEEHFLNLHMEFIMGIEEEEIMDRQITPQMSQVILILPITLETLVIAEQIFRLVQVIMVVRMLPTFWKLRVKEEV
jgi:hypothetical protein